MASKIIDFFRSYADIFSFLGAICTLVLSIYTYRNAKRQTLERERYDKLIFPLFDLLEPHLFTSYNAEIMQKAVDIMRSAKPLLGGRLMNVLYLCESTPGEEAFSKLCAVTNSELDRVSRIIALERRDFYYRINRRQFRTKLAFVAYIVTSCLFLLVCFVFFITLLAALTVLIEQLLSKLPMLTQ